MPFFGVGGIGRPVGLLLVVKEQVSRPRGPKFILL